MIVRCTDCQIEWDLDRDPSGCENGEHFWSLDNGPALNHLGLTRDMADPGPDPTSVDRILGRTT